jgi:hypothetical protein
MQKGKVVDQVVVNVGSELGELPGDPQLLREPHGRRGEGHQLKAGRLLEVEKLFARFGLNER